LNHRGIMTLDCHMDRLQAEGQPQDKLIVRSLRVIHHALRRSVGAE
jgi:hypothetical protein